MDAFFIHLHFHNVSMPAGQLRSYTI